MKTGVTKYWIMLKIWVKNTPMEKFMTDDDLSDLIGEYKSDESSTEGGDEVTVLVCEK